MNKETAAFAHAHRNDNVRELALHAKPGDGVDMPMALDQIAGWQIASDKLPEWASCDGIIYPPHISMEQCSSQFTAQYKADTAHRLIEHAETTTLVDLTGGFGVDFSYMARIFDHATYVERQSHLCELAEHNMAALGLGHVNVIHADAEQYLQSMPSVSLIFIDPARRDAHGSRTYAIADCTPDVLRLKEPLLAKAAHVMVKLSPMLDWRKTVADFAGVVHEVHIVSSANECKELLLVLGRATCDKPRLFCVNDTQRIDFPPNEVPIVHPAQTSHVEASDASSACNPSDRGISVTFIATDLTAPYVIGCHLYEPNASLMKAGCFGMLERRFGVAQIAPNSHLFISRNAVQDFPGRSFVIDVVNTMGKKALRVTLGGLTQANITVRNFPLSVAALRKKLKLKDGGETYLFATTDATNRHLLIRCHKDA